MAVNDYHFVTQWRIPGTADEIFNLIADAESLTKWWPSVYLDVKELKPGDQNGVERVIDLYTKGWMPYKLRWNFTVTEVQRPIRLALEAHGDFEGRGIWTLQQSGEVVDVTYDWKIRADKPLLRTFSFIMKPIFSANHRWAMDMGEKSLLLELARRRAKTPEALAQIPAPPRATFR